MVLWGKWVKVIMTERVRGLNRGTLKKVLSEQRSLGEGNASEGTSELGLEA